MSSTVLDKEEADKIVVVYKPKKLPQVISPSAVKFVSIQAAQESPKFHIDRIVAQQTGVAELERLSITQQVEALALDKVKEVQESSYQEAFRLGLDEGREQAFQEQRTAIEEKIGHLASLLTAIANLKRDLVAANETHLVKLLYFMASRIAMDEIQTRPEIILTVIKKAVESAQSEENVTVRLSQSDLELVNSVQDKLGKEFEILTKIKLEESEKIQPGGCIVETNYGSVDASIEQRLTKLWNTLNEKMSKNKDTIGEGS